MNEKIYIYLKKFNKELDNYLKSLPNQDSFSYENGLYTITINNIYHEDYLDIVKALEYDFYEETRIFFDLLDLDDNYFDSIYNFLKISNTGIYYLGELIGYYIKTGNEKYKKLYKEFIEQSLNKEIINSGLVFVELSNVILASKRLYIHRNTMNYRIETIKNKTSLDLRDFKDAFAFYGLFS